MLTSVLAKRVFASVALGVMLLAAAVLIACGGSSSPPQTQYLFVADSGNSRVLVYNAPFTTGQSASAALGQASFTTNAVPDPPTAASMSMPFYLAVDKGGNLYVADISNCRVLQFNPPFTTGMAATLAVGQASGASNLTTGCPSGVTPAPASATNLYSAAGVSIDGGGDLWVSDSGNNRVLKYPAPITAGEAATVVLGQTSFGPYSPSVCTTPSATTLCSPGGLAFDSAGNLWVADTNNHRVLMYPQANLVTGGSATVELGQPNLTSNTSNNGGVSAATLSTPLDLAFDLSGNLWVADTFNNRVLMYAQANLGTNGAAASVELGQPAGTAAFTSNAINNPSIGPSTLGEPFSLAFDSSGRLFVSGLYSNRTLVFAPPFANGINATLVLGQQDFSTGTPNTGTEGAATQYSHWG